jgi:UDP-3-O-[3-hydroxymyristoyl] N-acetylglucosamine deacetylase
MTLHPAKEDTGIVFKRTDVQGKDTYIPALYSNVSCTQLGTTLTNRDGVSIATIEHLMAAFWGCNIDNVLVEIDGPEVPIMDGSSEPFVFLVECAGLKKQAKHRRIIEVLKPISIQEGDKRVTITPSEHFAVSLEIDFGDAVISQQSHKFSASDISFKTDLCRARSFCFEHEVDSLREMGLAQGGSLNNAIVVGSEGVLNEDGLRYKDEFVRHKILDCIGDFYLSGGMILGHFEGVRSGHALNNKLLHKVFEDKDAWRVVQSPVEIAIGTVHGNA